MTTITFTCKTVTATNPDADDKRAFLFVVTAKNAEITAQNAVITAENARQAALVPPGPVTPLLPLYAVDTAANIRTSYEAIGGTVLPGWHAANIAQANQAADQDATFKSLKPLWADATPAKKAAALAALQ